MAEFHRPRQNQQTPRAHQCSAPNPDSQENTKATPSEFNANQNFSIPIQLLSTTGFVSSVFLLFGRLKSTKKWKKGLTKALKGAV